VLPDNTVLEYITDSTGRRVAKKVNGVITKAWLYQGALMPVAELDASGNVVSRFVGAGGNVPEYVIKGGVTYRIVTDQLGSVRMVVNASTGVVVQEMKYDEFGVITLDTNPGFTPFGFAGGIYDQDTKLTRFGARDYDAETGRWTSKDPIGFSGGDTNLYGYVLQDPVNGVDPEGLEPKATDKTYGLPDKFMNWAHRNTEMKDKLRDLSKDELMELYQEWLKLGKPASDHKGRFRGNVKGGGGVKIRALGIFTFFSTILQCIEVEKRAKELGVDWMQLMIWDMQGYDPKEDPEMMKYLNSRRA